MRHLDELDTLVIQAVTRLTKDFIAMTAKTDELAAAVADLQNSVVPAVASKIDEIMLALSNAKSGVGTIEDPAAIDAAIAALQTVKADLRGKVDGAVVS